jgi:hypothetical protein
MTELDAWIADWKAADDGTVSARIVRRSVQNTWRTRVSLVATAALLCGLLVFYVALSVREPKWSLIAFSCAMGVVVCLWIGRLWLEFKGVLALPNGGARAHLEQLSARLRSKERVLAFVQKLLWVGAALYVALVLGLAVERVARGEPLALRTLLLSLGLFAPVHTGMVLAYRTLLRRAKARLSRAEELVQLMSFNNE